MSIEFDLLNGVKQLRVFNKEFTQAKNYAPTKIRNTSNLAKDQVIDNIKVRDIDVDETYTHSLLTVDESFLSPFGIKADINQLNLNLVTSASDVDVTYEDTAECTLYDGTSINGYTVSPSKTRVYFNQNTLVAPTSVKWNFSDLTDISNNVAGVYVHISTDVDVRAKSSLNGGVVSFRGGVYVNLTGGTITQEFEWCPLISATTLTSRTIYIPIDEFTMDSIEFMIKGCKNFSIELLTVITGA